MEGAIAHNGLRCEKGALKMNRVRQIGISAVVALIVFSGTSEAAADETVVRRNPFVDQMLVRGAGAPSLTLPTGVSDFRLKGYIQNEDGQSLALLEIQGGGLHLVRAGDVISLRAGQQAVQLTVEQVSGMGVRVRVGENGPVMEVR
jgi:hypothetical protein